MKLFLEQIIDEKSLIKKYQREISLLKQELDQLRQGMLVGVNHEEILTLKQKVFIIPELYFCILIVAQAFSDCVTGLYLLLLCCYMSSWKKVK